MVCTMGVQRLLLAGTTVTEHPAEACKQHNGRCCCVCMQHCWVTLLVPSATSAAVSTHEDKASTQSTEEHAGVFHQWQAAPHTQHGKWCLPHSTRQVVLCPQEASCCCGWMVKDKTAA